MSLDGRKRPKPPSKAIESFIVSHIRLTLVPTHSVIRHPDQFGSQIALSQTYTSRCHTVQVSYSVSQKFCNLTPKAQPLGKRPFFPGSACMANMPKRDSGLALLILTRSSFSCRSADEIFVRKCLLDDIEPDSVIFTF